MEEHVHCKVCGALIAKHTIGDDYLSRQSFDYAFCIKCCFYEGLEVLKNQEKKR